MREGFEILKLIYLAIGPGIALAVYIYYSDRWEPEPKKLVVKGFIWGVLAVFPSAFYEETFVKVLGWEGSFNDTWWQTIISAFFGIALAEEVCKFFFLKEFIFDDPNFNDPFDGIVYGGMIGCGFATMENIIYVVHLGYETGISRMLTAVPGHVFNGIILGYFMGKAKFAENPLRHLTLGLVAVILVHGIYDSVAMSDISWSIYPVLGIVVLAIYLALKAKKEFEGTSKRIEFSLKEYFLEKDEEKQEPLTLKDIRRALSEGALMLEDKVVPRGGNRKISIRTLLSSQIGLETRVRKKIIPGRWPPGRVAIFYGLTFGLYLYFWFHRNYQNFKNYKNFKVNPDLRTLVFFVLTIIPFYIQRIILKRWEVHPFDSLVDISFNLVVAGLEAAFLYYLFQVIRKSVVEDQKQSFPAVSFVLVFFILSVMRKLLPSEFSHYWLLELLLILLQGGVLAFAQKYLNTYWAFERERQTEV